MSREIKFRAWDNLNKKWLLGYEYKNLGGFSLTGECVLFGEWGNIFDTFLFNKDGKKWDDLKIMQFTGLKDKNGKEIYEGDILDFGNKNNVEVIFDNGSFNVFNEPLGWDFDSEEIPVKTDFKYCEIVGNIHKNPELLNKK